VVHHLLVILLFVILAFIKSVHSCYHLFRVALALSKSSFSIFGNVFMGWIYSFCCCLLAIQLFPLNTSRIIVFLLCFMFYNALLLMIIFSSGEWLLNIAFITWKCMLLVIFVASLWLDKRGFCTNYQFLSIWRTSISIELWYLKLFRVVILFMFTYKFLDLIIDFICKLIYVDLMSCCVRFCKLSLQKIYPIWQNLSLFLR
jgi:hypothetical protein